MGEVTGQTSRGDDRTANIASWLTEHAASIPDEPAVKLGDRILSYARLESSVARCARLLADRGVTPGDRVALIMPNVPYFPVVYFAVLRLGAVVVPMNPLLKAGEIAFAWRDSGARVAVVFELFAEEALRAASVTDTEVLVVRPEEFHATLAATDPVADVAARAAEDTAVLLYTSGTTGTPKGAELSHANLASNVRTDLETLMPMAPGDVVFGGLPLFHSFGQTCAQNAALAAGACLTLLPKFDPEEALRIVERDRVTVFLGVPTMYIALLGVSDKERFDTGSLRVAASGGASLPVEVLHGVERAFGFRLLEGYGLSETSPIASFNHPDQPSKPGSIGTPIRGVEFRLLDDDDNEAGDGEIGEIAIRGENVMKGYWNRPEDTAEAIRGGWFHTGDLATRDAEGFYFIVDRKKDMIIRGGYNVYPREVEEVLYAHPDVIEAAVLGVPHPQHGEEVVAVVTPRAGATVTEEELREFVRKRIAAYKYPRTIKFAPIPKGPTGKILKREIKYEAL